MGDLGDGFFVLLFGRRLAVHQSGRTEQPGQQTGRLAGFSPLHVLRHPGRVAVGTHIFLLCLLELPPLALKFLLEAGLFGLLFTALFGLSLLKLGIQPLQDGVGDPFVL